MKKLMSILLVAVMIVSTLPVNLFTVSAETSEFAGGSGTEADPYLIETKYHLDNVRNHLDAHFKMIADVEFTDADFKEGGSFYNKGNGWIPISPFSGVFNGDDHSIKGLRISITQSLNEEVTSGLFGHINDGHVQKLIMQSCEIYLTNNHYNYVGCIAGSIFNGTIKNCFVQGELVVEQTSSVTWSYVGGLVGEAWKTNIQDVECEIDISSSGADRVGGIAGYFYYETLENATVRGRISGNVVSGIVGESAGSTVTQCYNYGNINGMHCGGISAWVSSANILNSANYGKIESYSSETYSSIAAGILANGDDNSQVSNCFNAGEISAQGAKGANAGGVVATYYFSAISNCYNLGKISSSTNAGGIVGFSQEVNIKNCYNVGDVDATYAGGLVGEYISSNFYDCIFLNNISTASGKNTLSITSNHPEEMGEICTFTNWDFENTWEFTEGNAYPYPTLKNNEYFLINDNHEFNGGSGTEKSPYYIASAKQLNNVRKYLDSHFKLVKDIVFTDADFEEGGDFYNNGQGWDPIASSYASVFTGTFDGNSFSIKNLYINRFSEIEDILVGLFGINEGTIKNLGLVDSSVIFSSQSLMVYGGGITGINSGIITNCYNTGSISGASHYVYSGGIVGFNAYNATITNCHNLGTVIASPSASISLAGGIAGQNNYSATITNCYNSGSVSSLSISASPIVGGIVGDNGGIITNCFNTGTVTAMTSLSTTSGPLATAGGIAGDGNEGKLTNCYNTGAVSCSHNAGGIIGTNWENTIITNCYYSNDNLQGVGLGDGTAIKLTAGDMNKQSTYVGFDFNNVWTMQGSKCYIYPELKNVEFKTDHIYDVICDTTCNCGHTRETTHNNQLLHDDNNHFNKCKVCSEITDKESHKFENICDTTCDCGYTRGVPDHAYENACDTTCNICEQVRLITHVYDNLCDKDCNVCGTTRETEHTYDDVCDKTCNICSISRTAPHSFGSFVYNDDATCTADGTKTKTCSLCGQKETIKATGTKLVDSSKLFNDVKNSAWYKPYIDYAATYKLLNGTGDGKMDPERTITRAEFVQVLANLSGINTGNKNVKTHFTDVKSGDWYAPAVKWANENGIVNGVSLTEFAPEEKITREQMCTMLVRYAENFLKITLEQVNTKKTFADDKKISDWAKDSVYKCQQSGLVGGVSATEFAPLDSADRASVATIMTRFHKQYI